ncbi:MAG: hypothetical protein R3C09_18805 [Pirellulaceae bacterium]
MDNWVTALEVTFAGTFGFSGQMEIIAHPLVQILRKNCEVDFAVGLEVDFDPQGVVDFPM